MSIRRILLLHAGGTIGMAPTAKGFAPKAGLLERALAEMPGAGGDEAQIDLMLLDPLIDSADATPADWNRLAALIVANHDKVDGIVVTHGTDTLAFTSSALAMSLEGLAKPVIITGAMVPLFQPGSDGLRNLSDAIAAIGTCDAGVWIQFAGKLLSGPRARKMHSTDLDAFAAKQSDLPPSRTGTKIQHHAFQPTDIAVLPVAPGGSTHVISYALNHCDGVVLRCFGSGTVPGDPILAAGLAKAAERGIPVVAISETIKGGTSLGSYAAGAILTEHGAIDGHDMTVEAAYVKLTLALSMTRNLPDLRDFIETPLCGEFGKTPPTT